MENVYLDQCVATVYVGLLIQFVELTFHMLLLLLHVPFYSAKHYELAFFSATCLLLIYAKMRPLLVHIIQSNNEMQGL